MRSRSHKLAVCLVLALGASACVEPLQNGGVTIVGDPSSRLGTLCRFRHAKEGSFCAEEAPEIKPAVARRIVGADDGLRGAFATGRPGDYVLENEEIVVVIGQPPSASGLADTGGHLVDAGDARVRVDVLGQVVTTLGGLENQAIYDSIRSGTERDGTAFVEVTGRAKKLASVHVMTRYALSPGARAVVLSTALQADGETAALDPGDVVLWGGATGGFARAGDEGGAQDATGTIAAPYLFGVGTGVAYALVATGGTLVDPGEGKPPPADAGLLRAREGAGFVTVSEAPSARLAGSRTETFERALVVAPRGDTAAIATELFYLAGGSPGGVEITPTAQGKMFLRPGENRVLLRRECAGCSDPIPLWIAQPAGAPATAELPPGKYVAKLAGGAGTSAEAPFEVVAGKVAKVTLPVTPGGLLRARVMEVEPAALASRSEAGAIGASSIASSGKPSPAKLQVMDAATGKPAIPPVTSAGGAVEIALPAGRYKVIASRGPERTIDEATIDVAPSAETSLDLAIARVVDTPGHVACDVGARTAKSLDVPVTLGARLRASAAEGIECAILAERDAAFDPGPAVDALELGAHLRAFAASAILGSPAAPNDDLLRVWIGRSAPGAEHGLDPLWSAIAAGRRVAPLAVSFTTADPSREPGYPRTYVAVSNDDPGKLAAADLVAGLARRDVVLTNGPFVTMRVEGVSQGGVASLGGKRRATIAVHVERAPWVDATELTLLAGGAPAVTLPLAGKKKTERGAIVDDVVVPLVIGKAPTARPPGSPSVVVSEPTEIVAVVRGARSLAPVIDGDPAETKPFAMTSPLRVEPGHGSAR